MTETVDVKKLNEVHAHVDASKSVCHELSDFFSFYVPGHQYMQKFKQKMWDGRIRLFSPQGTLYNGLLPHLQHFCEQRDYELTIDPAFDLIVEEKDVLESYIKNLAVYNEEAKQITPYPEQIQAFVEALHKGKRTILSPTATGKSLIIYCICHYLINKQIDDNKKILIVVPTTNLVSQLKDNFTEYSLHDENFDAETLVHRIPQDKSKDSNKQIYCSTWQSIYKMPRTFFAQFDAIIGDECHEYEAKSIKGILEKSTDAFFRIGLTGTLRDSKTNKLQIEGSFGPSIQVTTLKKAINDNRTSKIDIQFRHLLYNKVSHKAMSKMKYHDEIEFLFDHKNRNKYIASIALSRQNQNTLILVQRIKHLNELHKLIELGNKKFNKNYNVISVSGDSTDDERSHARQIIDSVEEASNTIIIATFGVFQRGISMRKLDNIIFGAPSKSLVRVLQSIGRGLRKAEGKEQLTLFDLVDDVVQNKKKNYSFNHGMERLKIYQNEQLPFKIKKLSIE